MSHRVTLSRCVQVGVMAAAVALSMISLFVLALGSRASGLLQSAGGVAARVVLLIFPPASRNALALFNCAPAAVSPSGCASLNGCSGGAKGSTVPVRILASNPYYVCWSTGGAHSVAGGLAAATLVCVVSSFSIASLCAVWRWASIRTRLPLANHSISREKGNASNEAAIAVDNPMRLLGGPGTADSSAVVQDNTAVSVGETAMPPLLTPFLSDYRPDAWYTRHADLALTLLLAALQVRCSSIF